MESSRPANESKDRLKKGKKWLPCLIKLLLILGQAKLRFKLLLLLTQLPSTKQSLEWILPSLTSQLTQDAESAESVLLALLESL